MHLTYALFEQVHAANEFLVRYQPDWELAYLTFGPEGEVGDFGMRRLR